jgi:rfaE bifunctional protein kinase chain/domain
MSEAKDIFQGFEEVSVLIVGDVMIDRYLSGLVDRISPEAPVPVVHLREIEDRLGGAANVALNVQALGATPYLCSVIGEDENSDKFLSLLPKNGLSDIGILKSPDRQTTVKTRVLASNQQLLRVDREDTFDLLPREEERFLKVVREALDAHPIQVILFQDYNKGVLSLRIIREVILESLKRGIPTIVDPKKANFLAYKHVTLFKPNLKEVREGIPLDVQAEENSLREAARYIRNQLGNRYTLITLSDKGLFMDNGEAGKIYPTIPRNIADVCGAGDTVVSVAALALALGLDAGQIAALSNLAGGQVCEQVGVAPVDKCQLMAEYEKFRL